MIYSGFPKCFDILLYPNMDYQIQITESLQRLTTVSAASESEAVKLVRQYYKKEKSYLMPDVLLLSTSLSKVVNQDHITNLPIMTSFSLTATVSNFSKSLNSSSI